MRWPASAANNPGFSVNGGVNGVSSIRWGTDVMVNWSNTGSRLFAIVLRAKQRVVKATYKGTNADGMTTSRTNIIDGQVWDLTVRDDSAFSVPIIGFPVLITDAAGLIGGYTVGLGTSGFGFVYTGTVVESDYDVNAKAPGERTIAVENLILIESQTGT